MELLDSFIKEIQLEQKTNRKPIDEPSPNVQDLDPIEPEEEKEELTNEQEVPKEEEEPKEEAPPEAEIPPEDPAMGGMDMGMDAMGMEMPGEENKPETVGELGRLYELKKIHARMSAVELYLSTIMDPQLVPLKENVTKAADLFNTVISNFKMFKEKIDDIIVGYYTFLDEVYSELREYFINKNKGGSK